MDKRSDSREIVILSIFLGLIFIGIHFVLHKKANVINTSQEISTFNCMLHENCQNKNSWNDRSKDIRAAYKIMKDSEQKYFLILSGQFHPWIYSPSISINEIIVMDEVMSDGTPVRRPGSTLKEIHCKRDESYSSCALAVSKMVKNM